MASLSPSKPSMIHVFLTSKEAYMMAGGKSSVSSRATTSNSQSKRNETHRSSNDELKRELIMAKRQAKTIDQLMGEEKSYKDELELTKINWNYKNRFKAKNDRQMEFKGAMNSLIQSFKSAEKNVQAIKKRNEDSNIDGEKGLISTSRTIDESKKEDFYGMLSKYSNRSTKTAAFSSTMSDTNPSYMNSSRSHVQMQKEAGICEDFRKFNKILSDTESLCQDIIPDIRKLAKTKKMQDMQFKRDKIALIEVLKNPGNYMKKMELKNQEDINKEKDMLHPYIRFLGYDNKEQVPNISKWSKFEQIESRYLYHQFTQIEKKSFQQIKNEQKEKTFREEQLEKLRREGQHTASSPTLSRNDASRRHKSASSSRDIKVQKINDSDRKQSNISDGSSFPCNFCENDKSQTCISGQIAKKIRFNDQSCMCEGCEKNLFEGKPSLGSFSGLSDQKESGQQGDITSGRQTKELITPLSQQKHNIFQSPKQQKQMINQNNNFIQLVYPSVKNQNRIKVGINLQDIDKQLKTQESDKDDNGKARISVTEMSQRSPKIINFNNKHFSTGNVVKFEGKEQQISDRTEREHQYLVSSQSDRKSILKKPEESSLSHIPPFGSRKSNVSLASATYLSINTLNANSTKTTPKQQFLHKPAGEHPKTAESLTKYLNQDKLSKTTGFKDFKRLSLSTNTKDTNSSHSQQLKPQESSQNGFHQQSQQHRNSGKNNNNQHNNLQNQQTTAEQSKKSYSTTNLEVPDFFNQMTLKDMNTLRKQTDSLKSKTQEILANLGNPENIKQNEQKGVTAIKRQMLTYQEHKDDILDTWDRKQVQQKQKNRQEIKNIVADHYKKQQLAKQRAYQNGEDSEDEDEIEILQSQGNQQNQVIGNNNTKGNTQQQVVPSSGLQSPQIHSKSQNLILLKQQQLLHSSETPTKKSSNALTYGQMKIKNMELIKHAKMVAAKSRESESSQKISVKSPPVFASMQQSKNGILLSPSKFKQQYWLKGHDPNGGTETNSSLKKSFLGLEEGDEEKQESLKKIAMNKEMSIQKSLVDIISGAHGNEQSKESKQNETNQQTEPSLPPDNPKETKVNFELSKLLLKDDKRKANLKLLQEKQQQKNQVKEYLNQALTRSNKLHSSQSDRIMTQIRQHRMEKESNQAEVDFKMMTTELQRKEKEFQMMNDGKSEEMIKRKKREDILFSIQSKIYSNKKFDPTRFFREEQVWKNTINEINEYTQGREDKLEKAKNSLLHPVELTTPENNTNQSETAGGQAVSLQKQPSQKMSLYLENM